MKTRIPIKRYVDDPSLTWEERYARLLKHHEEETKFLVSTIEELEEVLLPSGPVHGRGDRLFDGHRRVPTRRPSADVHQTARRMVGRA